MKDNTRPCDQLTSPAFRHLCSSTGKLDQAEKFSIGFPVLIDKFLEMFLKWDEFKMRERNGCLEGVGCSINVTLMLPIYQKRNTGVSGFCCLYLVTRDIRCVSIVTRGKCKKCNASRARSVKVSRDTCQKCDTRCNVSRDRGVTCHVSRGYSVTLNN